MKHRNAISVFAVLGLVVFAVDVLRNIRPVVDNFTLEYTPAGMNPIDLTNPTDLPYSWLFFMSVHLAIALRLYFHAWAVDDSLPRLIQSPSSFPVWKEWGLRFVWILLTLFLPSIHALHYTRSESGVLFSIELVYLALFGALVGWDKLMGKTILESSNPDAYVNQVSAEEGAHKRHLERAWMLFDKVLFFCAIVILIVSVPPIRDLLAFWYVIFYFVLNIVLLAVCLYQIIFWYSVLPFQKVSVG